MATYEVCGCVVVGDAEWAWVGGCTTLHATMPSPQALNNDYK